MNEEMTPGLTGEDAAQPAPAEFRQAGEGAPFDRDNAAGAESRPGGPAADAALTPDGSFADPAPRQEDILPFGGEAPAPGAPIAREMPGGEEFFAPAAGAAQPLQALPGSDTLPDQTQPTVQQLQMQLEAVTRQLAAQQARQMLDAQMDAIRRLDPELGSLEALARQPEFPAFDRLVRGGQDLVSAYKLAFFDRYAARSAGAARQAAINAARGKTHLATVGTGPLPADDGLTDELIRSYRLYNPGMSRRDIARYHAKYRKEN